ncbi:hypothetical protein RXV86_14380 [Alisedimentitalea sp. MJ-SS2]|uniref:hypothetical protein n=1 Tax=Aliisedimentitalea sp. MJ-SS2 TaxID=3049795 RepID=UPI00290D32F5|nr:hypothetical protein [Alisedimentitalea sp. MJ-SS2]MDU8928575.1 hypothetical protein [Alisedimentitalea sp. MJ-SS2]
MHLYDCSKRGSILPAVLPKDQIEGFAAEGERIKNVLQSTDFFKNLPKAKQKAALSSKHLMFKSRQEAAIDCGLSKDDFEFYWNYLSQYTHVFSFQFYRVEANGRGTGLKNQFDIEAMTLALNFGGEVLSRATTTMVKAFPDSAQAKRGRLSRFSPGPPVNSWPNRIARLFAR